MKQLSTAVFKTDMGWVGLAAAQDSKQVKICQIVLPRATKRLVEQELGAGQDTRTTTGECQEVVNEARRQVKDFLEGRRRHVDIPVDLSMGTTFQRRVWRVLHRIPYGRVRSYKWVAARVGGSRYARAVGMALGANPVPIALPCHRVVAHDGSLGGFGGGVILKRRLLELEGTLRQLEQRR